VPDPSIPAIAECKAVDVEGFDVFAQLDIARRQWRIAFQGIL